MKDVVFIPKCQVYVIYDDISVISIDFSINLAVARGTLKTILGIQSRGYTKSPQNIVQLYTRIYFQLKILKENLL